MESGDLGFVLLSLATVGTGLLQKTGSLCGDSQGTGTGKGG